MHEERSRCQLAGLVAIAVASTMSGSGCMATRAEHLWASRSRSNAVLALCCGISCRLSVGLVGCVGQLAVLKSFYLIPYREMMAAMRLIFTGAAVCARGQRGWLTCRLRDIAILAACCSHGSCRLSSRVVAVLHLCVIALEAATTQV